MLVSDWKEAASWYSMKVSFLGAAASTAWLTLTDAQKEQVLQNLHIPPAYLALGTFVAVMVGRLLSQTPKA